MGSIRVIFMGSPEFAAPSLRSLAASEDIEIPLVVTQPDRRAGRGRNVTPPAVKVAAEAESLTVFQPESLRDPAAIERMSVENPDVIIVVSYGEILRDAVLNLPQRGCINVHPSLLPAYRGSIPIPAAILNGDSETGISIIKLIRRMDAGPILDQSVVSLNGSETSEALSDTLAQLAAGRLTGIVRRWVAGEIVPVDQDERQATYTRELRKSDAQVDWRWRADRIERFVRAMTPRPGAWSISRGQRMSIIEVDPVQEVAGAGATPGELLIEDQRVLVGTGEGLIKLITIQPSGKKPMNAVDWARGARSLDTFRFECPELAPSPLIFTR